VTTRLVVRYVRDRGGAKGVERLLRLAGESRPTSMLEDERTWSSYEQKIALFEAAARVLEDPDVARKIGASVLRHRVGLPIKALLRTLGTPRQVLINVARTYPKTNATMECLDAGRNHAVVTYRLHDGFRPSRFDCDYNVGILSQVSALFGLPSAAVEHAECQVDGAERCVYRLRWQRRPARLRRRRDRVAYLEDNLAAVTDQFEVLQSTVADLVSASEVAAVLARIATRAGAAVRARRYLLAVRAGDDEQLSVYHEGFESEAEALAMAEELLAEAPGEEDDGSRLVVEVTSARRHYGRLAALFDDDHPFFPQERRLLATYARHAAAALDGATALEEVRAQRETANELLGLSRSLTQARSAEEVANRVAAAVPALVGAPRSSVFLWNEAEDTFRVAGAHGWTPELEEALRALVVHPSDTPEAARMLTHPKARVIRATDGDDFVRATLEAFGSEAVAVAPVLVRDRLVGTVVADDPVGGPHLRLDSHLMDRLRGLADQAAVALENVRLVDEIRRQALHDELTGLPNQLLFRDRVEQAMARAERHGERLAILCLDVDHFKKVNDSLGYTAGNDLVRQVGDRLRTSLRAQDTVARTGGDEFAVLLPNVESVGGGATVAEKLLAAFADPFQLDGRTVFVTASIGMALYPDHGFGADTLLRNADVAMYRAKERGRNNHQWYAAGMTTRAHERLELEAQLHRAIEEGELRVHYQPIFDVVSGRMSGVEALVRWQHPERGLLPPDRFLPLAEETGLVVAVDTWVLRTACLQTRDWLDAGLGPLRVAVNISGRTFQQPRLADTVFHVLREARLDPGMLELEVSENVAGHETRETMVVLERLRALGVRVAIDDFGTGYSVLSRLRGFPVNTMKVDKSFVQDIAEATDDGPIVAGLIAMAHSLGVEVTAEGVETSAQMAFLRRHGCDSVQGFLLARPVDPAVIPSLAEQMGRAGGAEPAEPVPSAAWATATSRERPTR